MEYGKILREAPNTASHKQGRPASGNAWENRLGQYAVSAKNFRFSAIAAVSDGPEFRPIATQNQTFNVKVPALHGFMRKVRVDREVSHYHGAWYFSRIQF